MEWIDINEQEPPLKIPVLVFRQTFNIYDAIYYVSTGVAVYTLPPGQTDGAGRFPFGDVTHWMPLNEETSRLSGAELIYQYVAQFGIQQ